MKRARWLGKGGMKARHVKRRDMGIVGSMGNASPLAEGIMRCYRRCGLDKPQKLRKGRGYKTIDSMVRKLGLKGVKLVYEPFSFEGYLPIQTIIPKSRSQKGQVWIAPEAVLTTEALLGVFPELAKTGVLSIIRHEGERCRGSALERYKKMEQLVAKKEAGRIYGFWGPHLDVEIMANVQHLVAHYKGREEFIREHAYDLLFTTCLYHELGLVINDFRFSEKVMMSSAYPRHYPFLKKDVIMGIVKRAEEARKELKERVERCRPGKLKAFSIAEKIRREIRVLMGD